MRVSMATGEDEQEPGNRNVPLTACAAAAAELWQLPTQARRFGGANRPGEKVI